MERDQVVGLKNRVTAFFFIVGVETLVLLLYLHVRPSEQGSRLFGAYSLLRLGSVGLFGILCGAAFWLSWLSYRRREWSNNIVLRLSHASALTLVVDVAFVTLTSLLLTPSYRFGILKGYHEASLPILVFFWVLVVQGELLFFIPHRFVRDRIDVFLGELKDGLGIFSLVMASAVVILCLIFVTGLGLRGSYNWYEAGVPLLSGQVWFGLWGAMVAHLLIRFLRAKAGKLRFAWILGDGTVKVILWFVAAFLWIRTPLAPNFFAPEPMPPNYEYYPYSDAANWDIGAQYALIGQGIANRNPYADHAGLMGLLALLHLLVGQDYDRLLILYVSLFAVYPVILYSLGKAVHSNLFGFFLAIVGIGREINAILAGSYLNLSHVKLLMTEFPTRVGLAALVLVLVLWLRNPQRGRYYVFPLGAAIACLILLRFNTLLLPVVIALVVLWGYGRPYKNGLLAVVGLTAIVLLALSPWMARSAAITGNPFFFIYKPLYALRGDFRIPSRPSPSPIPTPSLPPNPSSLQLPKEENDFAKALFAPIQNPEGILGNSFAARQIANYTLNHFVHNVITSVIILPVTPIFHDLRHTVYEVAPFWNKWEKGGSWQGALTPLSLVGLLLNIALICGGVAIAWKRLGYLGFAPLLIFLTYHLGTALARTSGGRYVVPVDWIVIFYYGLGVIYLFSRIVGVLGYHLVDASQESEHSFSLKQGLGIFGVVFLFITSMVMWDFIPRRYEVMDKHQILAYVVQSGYLEGSAISETELEEFITRGNGQAWVGRALYPRFFERGVEKYSRRLDKKSPGARAYLTFSLIGPRRGVTVTTFMKSSPQFFPHGSDVIVFGCRKSEKRPTKINALLTIILDQGKFVGYHSQPKAPLVCP